jgi:glycosyltransferase involved in cell wall biosynthesis
MMNIKNKVRFLGERDDIPQLLAISDMLVLPSYREGLGMVLLEAAAAGKPVVTTNIRGCRDVVIHGETGLLVPPRAVEELADAILDLLRDADKRKRMGDASRRRAEERFDQKVFFDQMDELYKQLLREKGMLTV